MVEPSRKTFRLSSVSRMHPALWLLLLPLLIVLLRGMNGFAYPAAQAPFSDLTLSHYTYTAFLRDQLSGPGSLPGWSPVIFSGAPFAANPLSGLWYPFGWLALVLPLPLAFNLLVGLHLSWGALGMLLLLRRQGLKTMPAVFGALAFALMPKLFAQWGAGHLTLLYAVPWTPWLLYTAQAAPSISRIRRVLPGVVLAIILLADVRWAVYAGALWLAWSFWLALRGSSKLSSETKSANNAGTPAGLKWLATQVSLTAAAAALLATCLWLPLLEFTRLTSRAVMTTAEAVELSLSPGGLLGLFYPPLSAGSHETTLYAGGVVLLLAVLALAAVPRRQVLFWGLVGGLALLFAMGSSLPGFELLAKVPLVSLLRVPPRALFLLGLAMAVLASLALDRWEDLSREPARRRARLALIGIAASGATIGVLVLVLLRPERPAPFVWGTLGLLAAGLWLMWGLSARRSLILFTTGLFVLLLIDPGLAGQTMVAYRPKAEVFAEKAGLAEFLQAQPGRFRTYAPDFSLLQFTAYNHGLEQADGVDPLQLEHYVRYMENATGIPNSGYSVTLPPVPDGFAANTHYIPDARLLGMLNVKYVLAGSPLPATDGLNEVAEIEGVRVYENRFVRPRAWVIPPGEAVESGEYQPAEVLAYTPNRIELSAPGPGTLVLAENSYPGWQVQVDGQPAALETAAGTLRAVNLDPGEHQVRFEFRPRTVQYGLIISTAALLGLLGLGLWEAARRKQLPF